MNMCGSACKEEDATAIASASCAELGRDEVKPGQRHRVLTTSWRETVQRMSIYSSVSFPRVFVGCWLYWHVASWQKEINSPFTQQSGD